MVQWTQLEHIGFCHCYGIFNSIFTCPLLSNNHNFRQETQGNRSEQYDFTLLDNYLDFLCENKLAPVFELMDNYNTVDTEKHWRKLIMRILKRYTGTPKGNSFLYQLIIRKYFPF